MKEVCENRLKNIAVHDRLESSLKIKKLLKSEMVYILKNYFDVTGESVDVDISVNEYGKYNITMTASANILRMVRVFAD